ncbi:MAG: GNAT family N-acetyltransferase [Clostridia bacterium]|nr:GNAT family N-acetyltransferase [Clostridia bacterium]
MNISIRKPNKQEYEYAAKELWHICFEEDGSAFVDYYFEHRTSAENVLAAFLPDGEMIGMMHILPYTVSFYGVLKKGSMVAGVATHPNHRKKGICRALFEEAGVLMRENGYVFSMLQPFDARFYEQFGYKVFSLRERFEAEAADTGEESDSNIKLYELNAEKMLSIYERYAQKYNGMMARTLEDCELFLKELETYNGKAVMTNDAYALYAKDSKTAVITEIAGENMCALINVLLRENDRIKLDLPLDAKCEIKGKYSKKRIEFNMLRIEDKERFFEGLPCRDEEKINGDIYMNYSMESY